VRATIGPKGRRRGRPPTSDGPSTEDRILRTAREVFAELGYEKCTFSEIAERAGVTRPAINHYFRGKKELYDAVFDAARADVVKSGVANALERGDLADRLTAFLETAAQLDSMDRSYARFISSSVLEGFRHPEVRAKALSQLEDVRGFVRQTLETAITRGEARADLDVPAVTEMLVAAMWGMGLYAGFVGTHDQLESVIEQFSRLLDGSLW
jgi:AcrR family transcriptional regulator